MTSKKFNPLNLLCISSLTNALVLLVACVLWTEFEILQVANVMFWVGALTVIVSIIAGGLFVPANKYYGQTLAIWTTLKYASPNQQLPTKMARDEIIQKLKIATSISIPGIILIIISFQML